MLPAYVPILILGAVALAFSVIALGASHLLGRPLLHLLQDQEGWLSTEALEYAASLLELTPAQVHDAATYYTMFRFKPEGKHQLEFCTNLSCALYGADELVAEACRRLGVEECETSADGRFTVHRVECLAACGGGPA